MATGFRQGESGVPETVPARSRALVELAVWLRIVLVAAAILAVIGLPLNTPERLWTAVACGLVLFASATRDEPWRYAAACVVALTAVVLKAAVPHTQLEISENLYLPTADATFRDLPGAFRAALDAAFLAANPRERWCDPGEELKRRGLGQNRPLQASETYYQIQHCWRNAVLPRRTFAFTGDAFFGPSPEVRVVDRLEIDGLATRPIAAAYAFAATWYFWPENRNRIEPTWYLAITLPERLEGSRVCSRGRVYWESERVWSPSGAAESCREIGPAQVGTRVWAMDTQADPHLTLRLDRSAALVAWDLALRIALASALAAIVLLTLKPDWLRLGRAAAWCAGTTAFVALAAPAFFTHPLTPAAERDPLLYRGYGYDIAEAIAEGRWTDALRGGEDVYLFMPGMRYFRALELMLFGDTSYATLLAVALTVPVLWYLAWRVLERRRLAFLYLLLCLPILSRLCSLACKGYGEAVGFLALIAGICLFLNAMRRNGDDEMSGTGTARALMFWAAFALVSLGAWIRPNFALSVPALGFAYLRAVAPQLRWRTSALVLSGGLLLFAAALHNLYFDGHLTWFTVTVKGDSLRADLGDYAGMIGEWLAGAAGEHTTRVAHQLYGWVWPVRWGALLSVLYLLARPGWDPASVVSAVCLAMYFPFLFYFSVTRHIQTADALGVLCALATLQSAFAARRLRRASAAA